MARRWYHEVSAEWLKARQGVLTATDVAALLPEYRRYSKAVSRDPGQADRIWPGFAALWCQKHSDTYLDTSAASDAAARGHVMEPWVVEAWNKQASPTYYHWDDCIICNGILGFSPDAMVIPQLTNDSSLQVTVDGKFLVAASQVHYDCPSETMETKCYEPMQHMKSIIEDRMEHKELMQVAMPFAVLSNLEATRLIWFCPGAPVSMFAEKYTRNDLKEQVDLIMAIKDVYEKQAEKCMEFMMVNNSLEAKCTEEEVYLDYIAEQSDNDVFRLK